MADGDISLSLKDIDAEIVAVVGQIKALTERKEKLEGLRQLAIDIGSRKDQRSSKAKAIKPEDITIIELPDPAMPYRGWGTRVAAIKYLRAVGEPQGAGAIADALIAGGKATTSKFFHRTVDNTLKNAAKKKSSELVKVGKKWALKEWALTVPMGTKAR
jgi:hypothetical protein